MSQQTNENLVQMYIRQRPRNYPNAVLSVRGWVNPNNNNEVLQSYRVPISQENMDTVNNRETEPEVPRMRMMKSMMDVFEPDIIVNDDLPIESENELELEPEVIQLEAIQEETAIKKLELPVKTQKTVRRRL